MIYNTCIKHDKDTDEYYIELSNELLQTLDWQVGDQLFWETQQDGSYRLTKILNEHR